jgi:hypothetical protein
VIHLWEFPAEDFAAWCNLVASPQVASHGDYMTLLAAIQAGCERLGQSTKRVKIRVSAMQAELSRRGLANTPDNRAKVIASD